MRTLNRMLTLFALLVLAASAQATGNEIIDADVSGNWYNPQQPGHGLQIEVLDRSEAVVAWYAFDLDGGPLWLFGTGEIAGDTLRAEVKQFAGPSFPPDFDAGMVDDEVWGEVVFRRTGCDTAELEWSPQAAGFMPGQLPLERLTRIDGSSCRGNWGRIVRWRPGTDAARDFEALFVDYPDGEEDFFELDWGYASLPEPWQSTRGVRISGNNHSDDLMMVLMRPLDGLVPDTRYDVELAMQFATDVPSGCAGVGGSPGESVYMRLGAAGERPDYEIVDGDRRATLDLGQQASAGDDALSAGNMANGADESLCTGDDAPWRLKRVSTAGQDFTVTSDETGRIWLYGLSDSGFEATTTWYLTEFVVRLAEIDS